MNDAPKYRQRIAEIDQMFEEATGWGSWMSEASSERQGLVRRLRSLGYYEVEDKFVLQTADGMISD